MAQRAHWRGYLKLSLVSCPIALYPAVSSAERVSFRQVNRQTGNRVRQQLVDSVTGEVVGSDDKGRGYQVGERQFLLVEDEVLEAAQQEARRSQQEARRLEQEARRRPPGAAPAAPVTPPAKPGAVPREPMLQAGGARTSVDERAEPAAPPPAPVRVENNRTIDIERFVRRAEIDSRYYDTPYYVAPRDEIGDEAFAVMRDAMRGKHMVGLGRVILSKRERPIAIEPFGKGLLGTTLRYAHEIRSEAGPFSRIPDLSLPDEMVELAAHILDTRSSAFDPAYLEDRYRTALVSMLREKQAQLPASADSAPRAQQNVIDLMEALKRSLETDQLSSHRKPIGRRTPRDKGRSNAPPAEKG